MPKYELPLYVLGKLKENFGTDIMIGPKHLSQAIVRNQTISRNNQTDFYIRLFSRYAPCVIVTDLIKVIKEAEEDWEMVDSIFERHRGLLKRIIRKRGYLLTKKRITN